MGGGLSLSPLRMRICMHMYSAWTCACTCACDMRNMRVRVQWGTPWHLQAPGAGGGAVGGGEYADVAMATEADVAMSS